MSRRISRSWVLVFSAWVFAGFAPAYATITGPNPYLSFSADSPFATGTTFQYFHLENVEDQAINTPGLTASGGFVPSVSNPNRDSVDEDDGAIDGMSRTATAGFSYADQQAFAMVTFTFDAGVLGQLPTHAGLVWVDGGANGSGAIGNYKFEAFDGSNNSLGSVIATLGDDMITGQTAEDRFFGVTHLAGISRLTLRAESSNGLSFVEADHIQYGAVPEPSSLVLMAVALGITGWFVARKRRWQTTPACANRAIG